MNNPPCLDCKERFLGCHDVCVKFQAFRDKRDMVNEKRREHKHYIGYEVAKKRRLSK